MTHHLPRPSRYRSGALASFWTKNVKLPVLPVLPNHITADVCVVGAGIAGLTTAYLLAREGKRVVVLDNGPISSGESSRTTAHLSNAIDDRYSELIHLHGIHKAQLAAQSHTAAIDLIEQIVHEEKIDCDFMRVEGYLFLGEGDSPQLLEHEVRASHQAGLGEVDWMDRAELDGFDTGPCIRFPRQAQFHPIKYLIGLAAAIRRNHGQIFAGVQVDHVEAANGSGSAPVHVTTGQGHTITAQAAVLATNAPINANIAAQLQQSPYRTYVIGAQVPTGSLKPALYWDTAQPYHYVRIQPGSGFTDLLMIGGEDHKADQIADFEERWRRLEAWGRARFAMMGRVEHRWSGQILETADGLAYIGPTPTLEPNIYIATGDSGMGMTHGTIAGILLRSLVNHERHPWAELYDPLRFKSGANRAVAHQDMNALR